MKKLQRVLIMAGGTGGHVFPGLAIADYFKAKGIEIHWLGTQKGLEAQLVPKANIPLHFIDIAGLRGKGIKTLLTAPFKIISAVSQAKKIIKAVNPDVCLGLGGFVSGPGGIASWLLKKPLIIHEQNAKAGFTNQCLAHLARVVLEAFPNSFKRKAVTIGNPVRQSIENLPSPQDEKDKAGFNLLVFGGSLGAKKINETVVEMLSLLPENERPTVWHQTGAKTFSDTEKLYESRKLRAKVTPFIEDMAHAYSWADMALCRAGALSISEICCAGLGAILIPYPHAVDDHQTANANFMVKDGAAICLPEKTLTPSQLAVIIRELKFSPEKRLTMGKAAYQLRQVNVVEKIYQYCEEVCH